MDNKLITSVIIFVNLFVVIIAILSLEPKIPIADEIIYTATEKTVEVIKAIETKTKADEETTKAEYMPLKVVATAYCPCKKCSGKYGYNTSTGARATAGRTIAVDPSVIPYHTTVIIDGQEYIAEDTGEAIKGNKIDIFFNTHEEAAAFGKRKITVYIKSDITKH